MAAHLNCIRSHSVRRNVRFIGEVMGVEITTPTAAAAPVGIMATTAEAMLVVLVVRVSHHLVGHVLLLAEEFLEAYDGRQNKSKLRRDNKFYITAGHEVLN